MSTSLKRITCPLCGDHGAEIGVAVGRSGGPRANRQTVLCPTCQGYIIANELLEPGAIPAEAARGLTALARRRYRDDASDMLEITEETVRAMR
jgi:hypothetical protein